MSRSGKMRIAAPTPAAFCRPKALPRRLEVPELLALRGVPDDRSHRQSDRQVLAILAMAIGTFTVTPTVRAEFTPVTKLQQCVEMFVALQVDVATSAAVSAAGTAAGHEFFAAKRHAAVSTRAAGNMNLRFVNKHGGSRGHRVWDG